MDREDRGWLQTKILLALIQIRKKFSTKGLELKASPTTFAAFTMDKLILVPGLSHHDVPKCSATCTVTESLFQLCCRADMSVLGNIKPRLIATHSNKNLSSDVKPCLALG